MLATFRLIGSPSVVVRTALTWGRPARHGGAGRRARRFPLRPPYAEASAATQDGRERVPRLRRPAERGGRFEDHVRLGEVQPQDAPRHLAHLAIARPSIDERNRAQPTGGGRLEEDLRSKRSDCDSPESTPEPGSSVRTATRVWLSL